MTGIAIYGTGVAAKRYTTGPWGEAAADTGAVTRLRMAGQVYDASAGLYYMGARFYDPDLGRFISEDPIGIAGGLNLYAYAGNDPVNAMDPSGTDPDCPDVNLFGHCQLDDLVIPNPPLPASTPDSWDCTWVNCWGSGNQADDMERMLDAEWHPDPTPRPSFGKRLLDCAKDHYGLNSLALRGAVAAPLIPLYKPLLGLHIFPGSSPFTNLLSATRLVVGDLHLPFRVLGTRSIFGAAGRFAAEVNPYILAGLLAYDAYKIGSCALK